MTEWIGTAEAAQRLGIKEASLYSYVSRGVLTRRKADGARSSLFSAAEVDLLARRGRPRGVPGGVELVIETSLTEISDDRLRFRGLDATALALRVELEDVANLLWTGSLDRAGPGSAGSGSAGSGSADPAGPGRASPGRASPGRASPGRASPGRASPGRAGSGLAGGGSGWQATAEAIAAGTAAQAALPAGTLPLERLQVIVPALATADPLRLHLDPPAVIAAGRCLIAGMVACLPEVSSPAPAALSGSIAERLVSRLCPADDGPAQLGAGLVGVLRAALVLLADHELASSTLAARVAASVRADPYAVVATGLGAVGGALHGGASFGAEVMLRSARQPADAARVVGELLRRGERIPGFGHFVYKTRDPRAVLVMELLRRVAPEDDRLAVAEAVIAEARERELPAPNIDFALAALATVGQMIPGAGEAIFAVARAAGWLAHALEEYARNIPIRPRGIYTGPIATDGDTLPR